MYSSLPRICLIIVSGIILFGTMSNADINKFFPQIKGKLSNIIWAHAVNNQSYLQQTLCSPEIMMIEADVVYGSLINSPNKTAIMAHTVNDPSDLSLDMFLQEIDAYNGIPDISLGKGKGIKLDFKSLDALNASLNSISKYNTGMYPFWLNADILLGNDYKKVHIEKKEDLKIEPVDPQGFLLNVKKFQSSVLSLGWTTNLTSSNQSYTDEDVEEMIQIIKSNGVTNRITFAVRAGLVANSLPQMKKLLSNGNSTLTIWSSLEDYPGKVDVVNLREVILDIGETKIFVDLPENLKNDLHLGSSGHCINSMAMLGTICIFIVMLM